MVHGCRTIEVIIVEQKICELSTGHIAVNPIMASILCLGVYP